MWTAYAQCIESIIWVSVCVSVHCSVSSSVSVYQRVSSVAIALACGCEEGRGVDCFGLRARFARIDLCYVLEAGPERPARVSPKLLHLVERVDVHGLQRRRAWVGDEGTCVRRDE